MDGAEASYRYSTIESRMMNRCVGGRGCRDEAFGVNLGRTASSADLGGSSKYSNENFEDRRGAGFHDNCIRSWVIRS